MAKKAIFGGTFDPIHNGHLHIAYEALYNLGLDKIIFMPSGNPPHKTEKDITDALVRSAMVEMSIRQEEKFEIDYYEIEKNGLSYTYETLKHYNELEPDTEWYFLTGADCLIDLAKWKNVEGILKHCKFTVFTRSGYSKEQLLVQKKRVEDKYKVDIVFLDMPLLEISSTDIRRKIKSKENIGYFLPESVYNTILELELYR